MNVCKNALKLAALALWAGLHLAGAATIAPQDFAEVVNQAGVVVEGTVVDLQVISSGPALARGQEIKTHRAPAAAVAESTSEDAAADARAEQAPAAPQSLPVEGGRMLFTQVTLAVEREIVGDPGSTVTFRVAGGEDGTEEVRVFGMPVFELGRRYLVFLRPRYTATADPIVGVYQGFFEITTTASGERQLLDAKGDIVVAIEDDRVVCRHNPERATGSTPRLGPAPVPEPGSHVRAATSPEVARYWLSKEPPLPVEDFVAAIRALKEN